MSGTAHLYIGGPLITGLLVAAVLEATTPIKPLGMIVSAIAQIVLTMLPLALIGLVGVAIYAYAQSQ